MLAGVLYVAGVTAAVAVVITVLLHVSDLLTLGRRAGIRLGLLAPPAQSLPEPVEMLARNLLRLRVDLETLDPHTPVARRRGIVAAYDDVLGDACRALGLDDTLAGVPAGLERETVRLEVEQQLVSAGLIPGRTPGR